MWEGGGSCYLRNRGKWEGGRKSVKVIGGQVMPVKELGSSHRGPPRKVSRQGMAWASVCYRQIAMGS